MKNAPIKAALKIMKEAKKEKPEKDDDEDEYKPHDESKEKKSDEAKESKETQEEEAEEGMEKHAPKSVRDDVELAKKITSGKIGKKGVVSHLEKDVKSKLK